MKARGWAVVTTLGIALLTMTEAANAYLDPGTGSMLLQLLIGAVVAAMFTAKLYWYRLKAFLKRLAERRPADQTQAQAIPQRSSADTEEDGLSTERPRKTESIGMRDPASFRDPSGHVYDTEGRGDSI